MRIKIGRFPDISVSQARQQVQKLKAQLTLSIFDQGLAKQHTQTPVYPSLKELSENYFKIRKLKATTLQEYRRGLDNHLFDWMKLSMDKITKQMILERHRRIATNSGDSMADSVMRTLRSLFTFFKDQYDFAGNNPVQTLSANRLWKTGIQNRRSRYIPRNQLSQWFKVFDQLEHETWKDYILFTLLTGLRKEEAAQLQWETVDLKEKFFFVSETKNKTPHYLPINSVLLPMLLRRKNVSNSKWVFPSLSDSQTSLQPQAIWRNISRKHNMKLSTHDLRRSFITIAEGLNIDRLTRKRLMNHSYSSDVTDGYIIHEVDRLREPSEKIAQAILSELKTPNTE